MGKITGSDRSIQTISSITKENTVVVLLAGSSKVALHRGISAAGSTPELSFMTPVVDSEIMVHGRCESMSDPPMTPEGIPTPAIVSLACNSILGLRIIVADCGFRNFPRIPFFYSGIGPAEDPSTTTALPEFERSLEFGRYLGSLIGSLDNIVIAETVPGGTTTAQAVLRMLGSNAVTSSSMISDPRDIKEEVVSMALKRCGRIEDPMMAVRETGDYTMSVALSMLEDLGDRNVIFAGGTQMANILNLDRMINEPDGQRILATTSWIMDHRGAAIRELVPDDDIVISRLDFSKSQYQGLREYERGHVREGVGMGFFLGKALLETGESRVYRAIDSTYAKFMK